MLNVIIPSAHRDLCAIELIGVDVADISMCTGWGCLIRETCLRFRASESKFWQSYLIPEHPGVDCEHYLPVKDEQPKR